MRHEYSQKTEISTVIRTPTAPQRIERNLMRRFGVSDSHARLIRQLQGYCEPEKLSSLEGRL